MRGRPTILNEDFFNQESEKVWYILGLLIDTYTPVKENNRRLIFRNKNYRIIEIIKEILDCRNAIVSDNRGKRSYFMEVNNKRLRLSLEERGLTPDKIDRRFPESIDKIFLPHYIRGFVEDQSSGWRKNNIVSQIVLRLNHDYLVKLNEVLREYCGVRKTEVNGNNTMYSFQDTNLIYEFIYSKSGLFIPEIKERFGLIQLYSKKRLAENMKKAEELLIEGKKGNEIYQELGYKKPIYFYTRFKKYHSGRGIRSFIRNSK